MNGHNIYDLMDIWDKETRSKCMARIRGKDTKPELIVRRYLHSRGYRYRKNVRRLPGTPDIVLRKYGVVIFVHGCFWHGHETHFRLPQSNRGFWEDKITRNRERDRKNNERLRAMGWSVITVWECQLAPAVRSRTLSKIEELINAQYLHRLRPQRHAEAIPYISDSPAPFAAEQQAEYGK